MMFCFRVFGCQYQCNRLPDLLFVERDVKLYTLTHKQTDRQTDKQTHDRVQCVMHPVSGIVVQ